MSIEILLVIFFFSHSAEVVKEIKEEISESARAGKNLLVLRINVAFIFWLYKYARLRLVVNQVSVTKSWHFKDHYLPLTQQTIFLHVKRF